MAGLRTADEKEIARAVPDPKEHGGVKKAEFEDDATLTIGTDPVTKKPKIDDRTGQKKSYVLRVTFNDGTTRDIYYQYGSNDELTRVDDTDPAVKKEYDDRAKQEKITGERIRKDENGNWWHDTEYTDGNGNKRVAPEPATKAQIEAEQGKPGTRTTEATDPTTGARTTTVAPDPSLPPGSSVSTTTPAGKAIEPAGTQRLDASNNHVMEADGKGGWIDKGPKVTEPKTAPGGEPYKKAISPADNKPHWFGFNPATNAYDKDLGLAPVDAKYGPMSTDGEGNPVQAVLDDQGKIVRFDPVPGGPKQPTVKYGSAIFDDKGNPIQPVTDARTGKITGFEPVPGGPRQPGRNVKDMPLPPGVISAEAQKDLTEYADFLQQQMDAGQLTPEEAKARLAARHATWDNQIKDSLSAAQTVYTGGINQRNQDVSLINQRAVLGDKGVGMALQTVGPALEGKSGAGSNAGQIFLGIIEMQRKAIERMGGLQNPQAVQPTGELARAAGVPAGTTAYGGMAASTVQPSTPQQGSSSATGVTPAVSAPSATGSAAPAVDATGKPVAPLPDAGRPPGPTEPASKQPSPADRALPQNEQNLLNTYRTGMAPSPGAPSEQLPPLFRQLDQATGGALSQLQKLGMLSPSTIQAAQDRYGTPKPASEALTPSAPPTPQASAPVSPPSPGPDMAGKPVASDIEKWLADMGFGPDVLLKARDNFLGGIGGGLS